MAEVENLDPSPKEEKTERRKPLTKNKTTKRKKISRTTRRPSGEGKNTKPRTDIKNSKKPSQTENKPTPEKDRYLTSIHFDSQTQMYSGTVFEVPQIVVLRPTKKETLEDLDFEIDNYLSACSKKGTDPAPPFMEKALETEVTLKLSLSMRKKLEFYSQKEGTEIKDMMLDLIATGLERRFESQRVKTITQSDTHHNRNNNRGNHFPRRSQNRSGNYHNGNQYHNNGNTKKMDNAEGWMDYVRRLEKKGN